MTMNHQYKIINVGQTNASKFHFKPNISTQTAHIHTVHTDAHTHKHIRERTHSVKFDFMHLKYCRQFAA
jgi:hypothetical protein